MSTYYPRIVPSNSAELPQFLNQELHNISQEMTSPKEVITLEMLNSPPTKIREGMIVLADGTNWNPGSGQGVYCYYNSTWNKLG